MAIKAVAAAPQAISETSAKTENADRTDQTQAVDQAKDNIMTGNGPVLVGETQLDQEHISPASPDEKICEQLQENTERQSEFGDPVARAVIVNVDGPSGESQSSVTSMTKFRDKCRQLVAQPPSASPTFSSVDDFVEAYNTTDKIIAKLTPDFVKAVGTVKEKQDEIVPHLARMQSLLSKKGTNHDLVIEARKIGHNIPWWTDYYETYKDRLWESLRTMERRIASYRNDPSLPARPKPEPIPQLRKSDRKALIDAAGIGVEMVTALEQGEITHHSLAALKKW